MNTKTRLLSILFILTFMALACSQFDIGVEGPPPTVPESIISEPSPSQEPEQTLDQNDIQEEIEKEDLSEDLVDVEDCTGSNEFGHEGLILCGDFRLLI